MKKYLMRWNENGDTHSAVFNIYGIRRLMKRFHEDGIHLQVAVYKLAESDVYMPPIPIRPYYDWKFDKMSLFDMSGGLVEKVDGENESKSTQSETHVAA